MTNAEILSEVGQIIRFTFGADDDIAVDRNTVAFDIDGWDSLSHATLMIMIERKYGITISEEESNALSNVGALCDLIAVKTGKAIA